MDIEEQFQEECKRLGIEAMVAVQRKAAILTMPSVADLLDDDKAGTGHEHHFRLGLCLVIQQLQEHLRYSLQAEVDLQALTRK
jgi:hypothetical protein